MCRLKGEGGRCYYHAQINYQTAKRKTLNAAKKSAVAAGVEIDQDAQQRLNQRNQNLLIQATSGVNILNRRKQEIEDASFEDYENDRKAGELAEEQYLTAHREFDDMQEKIGLLIEKQGEPKRALKTDVKSMGLVNHPDGRTLMENVSFAQMREQEYQRLLRVLGPDNVLTHEAGVSANSAKVNAGSNNGEYGQSYNALEEQYDAEIRRLKAMSDKTAYYNALVLMKSHEVQELGHANSVMEIRNRQKSNLRMDKLKHDLSVLEPQIKDQEQALKEAKKLIRDKTPVFMPDAFEQYYATWVTTPDGQALIANEHEKRAIMQATPGYLKEMKEKLENSITVLERQAFDPSLDVEKTRKTLSRYRAKLNTVTKNLAALRSTKILHTASR